MIITTKLLTSIVRCLIQSLFMQLFENAACVIYFSFYVA